MRRKVYLKRKQKKTTTINKTEFKKNYSVGGEQANRVKLI